MHTPHATQTPLSPALERRARRNVGLRWGWYVHGTVFVLVNAGLWLAGREGGWLGLPTGGWIVGLLAHGLVAWLGLTGDGIRARLLDAERRRLQGH